MTTLANIRSKIRQLTGRKSQVQLSDTEIDFQINSYYQYEFPAQFRSLDLRIEYTFVTQPNVDVYNVAANTYQSFEPTAYVAGYPTYFIEDRSLFHKMFPDIRGDVLLTSGNGGAGPYTGTVSGTPILKQSVLVYADTAFSTRTAAADNSDGLLYPVTNNLPDFTAASIGTVNYETGAISVTFSTVVPSGNEVRVQSKQYNATRPTAVFYWNNQLTLRPVPDKAYQIRIIAYQLPTALVTTNPASAPELAEWWQMLAYGAAMKIFENNKDMEGAAQMSELLERQLVLMGRREWFQVRSQRTSSFYNSPTSSTSPAYYYGFNPYW